ncbi:MAG: hypothetical protein HY283_10855 [Nitrospirae bacterium]|nr:hypothetical protein [Nitrospirota bacterium]
MLSLFDSLKPVLCRLDYGALTAADDRGQLHVFVKLPHPAVRFIADPLPIRHFLFLFPMPTAPVIGWFFEVVDNTQDPFRVVTYFNILEPVQARNLVWLAYQTVVPLHYVDGGELSVVATKRISSPPETIEVFQEAVANTARIRVNQYDFDRAMAAFEAAHSLAEIATWRPRRPSTK